MAKQKNNKVQEYFINIFKEDLSDKDFFELQQIVGSWLVKKIKEKK